MLHKFHSHFNLKIFHLPSPNASFPNVQTNLALGEQASTKPQSTMVPKANCGLAVFPSGVLPPTGSSAPDAHHVSKKTGFLLPQSTQCIDGNIQSTQFQTTKPSGLRMPSPSLGFFGQVS